MGLLADIKKLFVGVDLPEDAKAIIAGAESSEKLIQDFEDRKTRLLMDLRDLEDQALLIEQKITQEKVALNAGNTSRGEEDIILRRLRRLEADRDALRTRIAHADNNVNLASTVINKVLKLESMHTGQVTEELLDDIGMREAEEEKSYWRVRDAARDLASLGNRTADEHDAELEEFRKRYKEQSPQATEPEAKRIRRTETE